MQITVIGTGYVGLVSGVCFSEYGFRVTCVDKDADKIAKLQQQIMPIYEPGLSQLIETNRRAGRLSFSTNAREAAAASDIIILAVGTPTREQDGMPNLEAFNAAVAEIAPALGDYTLIVVKSTVPVGTCRALSKRIAELNPDADFDVVSNPEFLRQGAAVKDFMAPDRIVAGIDSKRAKESVSKLYAPISMSGAPLFFTTFESSEIIKYAANCMLAARVAFINEMSDICEKTGANIRDVARGIGMDKRIGEQFLRPGPGFGGSCFPKDARALKHIARQAGSPSLMIEAMIDSNETRKIRMTEKIIEACGGNVKDKTIAVLGLTFKPQTGDMRESVSLSIVPALLAAGARIRAYDPEGMPEARTLLSGDIHWCIEVYEALDGADAAVVLTEWNEFRSLDFAKARGVMKQPLLVDLRNIYKRQDMKKAGFRYVSIGRKETDPESPWISDLNIDDEKAA